MINFESNFLTLRYSKLSIPQLEDYSKQNLYFLTYVIYLSTLVYLYFLTPISLHTTLFNSHSIQYSYTSKTNISKQTKRPFLALFFYSQRLKLRYSHSNATFHRCEVIELSYFPVFHESRHYRRFVESLSPTHSN